MRSVIKNHRLSVSNVEVRYNQVAAVSGVNLDIEHAQIGCLLGPSGCGKSTLLRAIAGFESISEGHIQMGDETLSTASMIVAAEQRGIGMVFQDIALFPHLTIEKNISFGLKGWSK